MLQYIRSEPKLQANHFGGYATFIIEQERGMPDSIETSSIHMTEKEARELAYEILEQLNKI